MSDDVQDEGHPQASPAPPTWSPATVPTWWPVGDGRAGPETGAADVEPDRSCLETATAHAGSGPVSARSTVLRWALAGVTGVAVALLAVLGIDAVASAATAVNRSTPVFGPFGGSPNRNPPFLAGASTGGPAGNHATGTPSARPAAPPQQPTGATVHADGVITSIAGNRVQVTTSTDQVAVELSATTAIHDGTNVIAADALRVGDHVRASGPLSNGVVAATNVDVVH